MPTSPVIGFFVAATVVALMQFLRTHDKRVLPLMVLFLAQAGAYVFEWWEPWRWRLEVMSGLAGLVLLACLDPHLTSRR